MCRNASAQWHVGTTLPILTLILNAIPSNAFRRIIEADIRPAIAGFRVQSADRHTTRSIVKMTIVPNEHTVL